VLTVTGNYTNQRPSMLPAVWAQVSGVCIRSASPVAHEFVVGQTAARTALLATGAPQLPQVHQVFQAATAAGAAGIADRYGTNATTVISGVVRPVKRTVDGVSGAPPRGRPV
jgi:hypothetical protein